VQENANEMRGGEGEKGERDYQSIDKKLKCHSTACFS
jgi:hypothetical protein